MDRAASLRAAMKRRGFTITVVRVGQQTQYSIRGNNVAKNNVNLSELERFFEQWKKDHPK